MVALRRIKPHHNMKPIKCIFSVLSFIACSLSFSATHAQSDRKTDKQEARFSAVFSVSDDDPQKVIVKVENPYGEKLSIDVFSYEQGYVLSKTVQSNTYKGSLNFSSVLDGDYVVQVSSRKEKISRIFSMQTRQIESRGLRIK